MHQPLLQKIVDSTTSSRNVVQTLRNDAVESTLRCRNGSQTARPRTLRAGTREFANNCGNDTSMRPHPCATRHKRCNMA
eukprot:7862945-Lingulodinium_polyedra.AAC.1